MPKMPDNPMTKFVEYVEGRLNRLSDAWIGMGQTLERHTAWLSSDEDRLNTLEKKIERIEQSLKEATATDSVTNTATNIRIDAALAEIDRLKEQRDTDRETIQTVAQQSVQATNAAKVTQSEIDSTNKWTVSANRRIAELERDQMRLTIQDETLEDRVKKLTELLDTERQIIKSHGETLTAHAKSLENLRAQLEGEYADPFEDLYEEEADYQASHTPPGSDPLTEEELKDPNVAATVVALISGYNLAWEVGGDVDFALLSCHKVNRLLEKIANALSEELPASWRSKLSEPNA